MSPDRKTAAGRAAATVLLLCAIAACGILKSNEEAQAVVNQRVVGMSVGDFFDRYGAAKTRHVEPDGTSEYGWISAIGATPNSGFYGLDDRTCTLRVLATKNGRITLATVLQDMPGRTTTSRCGEIFKAP